MKTLARGIVCAMVLAMQAAEAADSSALRLIFRDPPREYSTGPLWTWNDLLTEEQVVTTLRDLASQKVRQVWVHPQPGLMTPYLSDDWFRLWNAALQAAKRLDMNIWMYDENSYPSGFAGGYVPEAMPESRGRGLHFREEKRPGQVGPDVLAVFRMADDGTTTNVTQETRTGKPQPEAKYLVAVVARAANSPWHAGRCYVDLLYPGVTQKFLEITLEPYRKRFGDEFGKHIPGVFMDEPSIVPGGGLPWTDDLPQQFQKRWGYVLLEHLPSLVRPVGDWRRVRHNYFQVLLDLFIERWGKPYYEYCEKHDIELTGHYLEHEWPNLTVTPDFMALQAWEHRPGIDVLFNRYEEQPHAQFGNVRIVKEIGSVANQLGRRRTLSETYAGSGHEIRFEEMKRQGDWQCVLGLNTLNECLSHVTIRGVRKGNWPRTLSYHNPWWEGYHVLAIGPYGFESRKDGVEARFELPPCGSLLLFLTNTPRPSAPQPAVDAVQIKPLAPPTIRRLDDNVLVLNFLDLVAGEETRKGVHCRQATNFLFSRNGFKGNPWFEAVQFADEHIRKRFPPESGFEATYRFAIASRVPDRLHLVLERPDLYQSITCNGVPVKPIVGAWWLDRSFGRIDVRAAAKVGENTVTVKASPFTVFHELEPAYVLGDFNLQPVQRGFVIVPEEPLAMESQATAHGTEPNGTMWLSSGIGFRPELPPSRKDDTAPFVAFDLGKTVDLKALRIWNYNEVHWSKLGVKKLAVSAGQTELADRLPLSLGTFELKPAPESAVDADTSFPQTLPVAAKSVRFIRFDVLSNHNEVVYPTGDTSRYFAFVGLSEVQFLDFAEQPIEGVRVHRVSGELDIPGLCSRKASHLVDSSGLTWQGWNSQGHPFYSGGVEYSEVFDVAQSAGDYYVEIPEWLGSVAKVSVNGKLAGYVGWRPWQCKVTGLIRAGRNTVEVTVFGTLRNTLGPHHAGAPQGIVSPPMFNQAPASGPPPGQEYTTLGYGLFRPFELKNVK